MYPEIPYEGVTWPLTQHAGVLSEESLDGLLKACLLCRGNEVDPEVINAEIVGKGILTANFRSDSKKVDAWRDYQQILSEFGLIVSTRLTKVIILTPVAMAYLNKTLSYKELITLQILRYQYPNGHKSQLSSSLVDSVGGHFGYTSFTEFQASHNYLLRPAVLMWQILFSLWQKGKFAVLTLDEMQRYVVRCVRNDDAESCVEAIIAAREQGIELPPLPRARRNMADWIKVLSQTLLFKPSASLDAISLSSYSVKESKTIKGVCELLANPASFWICPQGEFKRSWFDFYGNYDESITFVLKEK